MLKEAGLYIEEAKTGFALWQQQGGDASTRLGDWEFNP